MEAQNWFVVAATLFVALILTLLPMPDWTVWLRPAWVLIVLIYWGIVAPHQVGIGVAWMMGIFLDVLSGTLLGEHALALTVVIFIVMRLHSQLRMFLVVQQGLWVFLFVLLYQFILYCIQGFIGQLPTTWLYWSPALTSMLLWPWVSTIIRDCRRRFRVA